MLSTLKKRKSDKANIDQQLYNAIYRKVTKERHNYPSPQKGDKTITECIEFFKAGANPNILSELEKSLIGQKKHYDYYINKFLPALETEVMVSSQLFKLPVLNKKAEQPQRSQTIRGKILKIISEITNKGNDKNHPNNTVQNQGPKNLEINDEEELGKSTETPKLNDGPDSPVPSEKSPLSSPVSSRRDSINTTLSSVEEDDLQKINEGQLQPEQPAKEEQNTQENENSGGQANPIGNGNPQKRNEDQPQLPKQNPEEKPRKQENENSEPTKQPNNRNFRIALATCCALSVGCFVTGVVTLGMVGAGLLVMSVVFAIAAAVTQHLTSPSSKLTSTDLSPLIDDSKQR
ncbi:MAG: hypothetical protein LKM43_02900 [Wolbachia endosymbiont of Penenirmus auritus]|nr:hypothetical protein [Wolbachia endosymbiont of Penenirmus auritus]